MSKLKQDRGALDKRGGLELWKFLMKQELVSFLKWFDMNYYDLCETEAENIIDEYLETKECGSR